MGSATNDLRRLFTESGLAAPPVPEPLEPALLSRGTWLFATREVDPMAMYSFEHYLVEAVAEPVEDYIAISHAGHGANSYALNYQLVYGPVAIFIQAPWGGVYTDGEAAAREVARQFAQCGDLIAAAEASAGRVPGPPARLIVAESGFRGISVCEWLTQPLRDKRAAQGWLDAAPDRSSPAVGVEPAEPPGALARAVELLRARP